MPCTNCVAFSIDCKIPTPKRKKTGGKKDSDVYAPNQKTVRIRSKLLIALCVANDESLMARRQINLPPLSPARSRQEHLYLQAKEYRRRLAQTHKPVYQQPKRLTDMLPNNAPSTTPISTT